MLGGGFATEDFVADHALAQVPINDVENLADSIGMSGRSDWLQFKQGSPLSSNVGVPTETAGLLSLSQCRFLHLPDDCAKVAHRRDQGGLLAFFAPVTVDVERIEIVFDALGSVYFRLEEIEGHANVGLRYCRSRQWIIS